MPYRRVVPTPVEADDPPHLEPCLVGRRHVPVCPRHSYNSGSSSGCAQPSLPATVTACCGPHAHLRSAAAAGLCVIVKWTSGSSRLLRSDHSVRMPIVGQTCVPYHSWAQPGSTCRALRRLSCRAHHRARTRTHRRRRRRRRARRAAACAGERAVAATGPAQHRAVSLRCTRTGTHARR